MKSNITMKRRCRFFYFLATALLLCAMTTVPALAADDPLEVVNNLNNLVFSGITAIGRILLGFGLVQIGMSIKSQDAGQRATGFLAFFGGLLIAFAKPILDSILG